MRAAFPELYRPTAQEIDKLWEKCIFVVDTNVLLDLYRFSPKASKELADTLKILSDKNRLWIPNQVALEYNKNRLSVINIEKSKFKSIPGIIDNHINALKAELEKNDRIRKNTYTASMVSSVKKAVDKCSEKIKKDLKKEVESIPNRAEKDDIEEMLSTLLKGKIGEPYKQEELEEIYRKCKNRYELKIPPGYEDPKDKPGRERYGDAILWFQLIDYAKGKKLPAIVITSDTKKDWWIQGIDSNDKQPDFSLIKEFTANTGCSFYMYTSDQFLSEAAKRINAKVSKETIEEIKKIRGYYPYVKDVATSDRPLRYFSYSIVYDAYDSDDDKKAELISTKFKSTLDQIPITKIISRDEASSILDSIAKEYSFDRISLQSWGTHMRTKGMIVVDELGEH